MIENSIANEFFRLRNLIINKDFQYLDDEQRRAVFTSNRNVLITACPGSGKTTSLINRVKYLSKYGPIYNSTFIPKDLCRTDIEIMNQYINSINLDEISINRIKCILGEKRVSANNIVVITFTKAAAANMKKRFAEINEGKLMPFFGTFHGLFYKILFRHLNKINLIQSYEEYKIISKVLEKHFDEINEDKVKEIRNEISILKSNDLNIQKIDNVSDKDILIECYKSYEAYKSEKQLLDFDDLQLKCRKLFQGKPDILKYYRDIFKYILVDEFQDVDHMQLNILKMLNKSNSIFALGDEDQCIYSFRGSRPDYMVDFTDHFEDGIKLTLSTNYRSSPNIVEIANSLIKNNLMRNEKSMHSNKKCKKVIKVLKYDYENSQSNDIALIIDKLKNNEKYEFNESAVLYRTNMESRSIIDAFIRKRIPFRLLDKEYNFFEHFICKDILAYLKLSIMPYDYDCFKRIINKPFRYVSKINIEKVKNSYLKMDCFEQLTNIEGLPVFQIKSISNIQKDINRLDKLNLQSAIQYIINNLGYQDYLKDYCLKYKIPISELDEIIEEFKEAADEFNTISRFLVHVESVSERLKSMQYNGNDNAVVLSTIHGVKGMEFKNVFIINCVDGVIPHVNNMEKDLEEERRLFFVGITRVIENLYIGIPNNIRGKNKEVSRFIKECNIYNSENYSELYKPGDKILHSSFGEGTVKDIDKEIIKIEFGDFIDRSFALNVLHNNGIIKKL